MWTVSWAWDYVTQFNTVAHERQRQTGKQGLTRPHYRLGTSHHWTRSPQPATITLSIVNMRMSSLDTPSVLHSFHWCLFMVHFRTSLGTEHSVVSNGTVTCKRRTAEDLDRNNRDIIQVLSQHVSGRTKEKHEKPARIATVLAKTWNTHITNTNLEHYYHPNLLCTFHY